MKLTIKINCDNEAFADGNCGLEVQRILRKLADAEPSPTDPGAYALRDINGNSVGFAEYTDD